MAAGFQLIKKVELAGGPELGTVGVLAVHRSWLAFLLRPGKRGEAIPELLMSNPKQVKSLQGRAPEDASEVGRNMRAPWSSGLQGRTLEDMRRVEGICIPSSAAEHPVLYSKHQPLKFIICCDALGRVKPKDKEDI